MTTLQMNSIEKKMLDEWIASKITVMIYLKNGISLKGLVVSYSDTAIFLSNDKLTSKVFKQAITTISPYIAKD